MLDLRRREVITLIGGAAVAWPLAARAQRSGKLPTIGYLGASTPADAAPWTAAFVQRLRELGWVEGRTVAIEYRWGEARSDRWAEITAEFVRLKVDVIATYNTPTTVTAKKVTSAVPIIFALAADPVGSGLVASLARPGGASLAGVRPCRTGAASRITWQPFPVLPALPGLPPGFFLNAIDGVRRSAPPRPQSAHSRKAVGAERNPW